MLINVYLPLFLSFNTSSFNRQSQDILNGKNHTVEETKPASEPEWDMIETSELLEQENFSIMNMLGLNWKIREHNVTM